MKHWFFVITLLWSFQAISETFVAGKDYIELPATAVLSHQGDPTVTEFFSFGCPACYHLEKPLMDWVKSHQNSLHFTQIPVIFHAEWVTYAKAYYTAESLGILPTAAPKLFKAIHEDKNPLTEPSQMAAFFAQDLGVDPNVADTAFLHLTKVDMQVNDGMALAVKCGVTAIPAFVVNGRYKTDLSMAQSPQRLLMILAELSIK